MNLLTLFRAKSNKTAQPTAHMTWGTTSIGRALTRHGLFLKKQLWIWPIVATIVLAVVAYSVRTSIESTIKSNLRSQLQTLLDVQTAMLENWLRTQASDAASLANDIQVRETVHELLALSEEGEPAANGPTASTLSRKLRKRLNPSLSAHDFVGFFVANKSKQILASSYEELVGRTGIPEYDGFITQALTGQPTVSPPFASVLAMKDDQGRFRTGVPTMFVCAPIRDAGFDVVAVLALRIRPELEFTRILQLGRIGKSGETYAFDKSGTLVSNSRFDESLILLGLLPDQENSQSILKLQLRDPLGDMTQGHRPAVRRSELPLTFMAAEATAGRPGVNVDGYRDYRGVPTVGAWTWLKNHDLGIATEIDAAEAFHPLVILERSFWVLYSLLGTSSVAIFVFTFVVARLRREAQRAEIEARHLGQYQLEQKLGSGGMGVVYKGKHAMLRRPTAIKLLDVDKVNDASIQRFEREVQITCQLNHPNTVAIYDYGRTPEGVFYYAMEYLDGINLQSLVEQYGPQPEGRVIRILTQVCGSLYEAHSSGLVHRDIKPANIMLNRRGGDADVVKVLDFGLVKAPDDEKQSGLTSADSLTGTPLYMAPEAITSPALIDARSDLYAVGAVAYFLLTGNSVFSASNIVELCQQHLEARPVPPSERLGQPVSRELEDAILACLEKSQAHRPRTARELALSLGRCPTANTWTTADAEAWWTRHGSGNPNPAATGPRSAAPSTTAALDHTVITDRPEHE